MLRRRGSVNSGGRGAMFMIVLIAALAGQVDQDAPTVVDPLMVESRGNGPPRTLPDNEIILQLNALRKAEPDRVICLKKSFSSSLISRTPCATLRQWYDLETARDTQYSVSSIKPEGKSLPGGPPPVGHPDELVRLVKQRLKHHDARAQARQRAMQRIEAGSAPGLR